LATPTLISLSTSMYSTLVSIQAFIWSIIIWIFTPTYVRTRSCIRMISRSTRGTNVHTVLFYKLKSNKILKSWGAYWVMNCGFTERILECGELFFSKILQVLFSL
jgi:hypothetical protein